MPEAEDVLNAGNWPTFLGAPASRRGPVSREIMPGPKEGRARRFLRSDHVAYSWLGCSGV